MSDEPKLEAVRPHERLTVFLNWSECVDTLKRLLKLQDNLAGVVIVAVGRDNRLLLLARHGLQHFNDDRTAENPVQYRQLRHYLNAMQREIDDREGEREEFALRWSLGWWEHPESNRRPLEKYLRITGNLYPGSPTQ